MAVYSKQHDNYNILSNNWLSLTLSLTLTLTFIGLLVQLTVTLFTCFWEVLSPKWPTNVSVGTLNPTHSLTIYLG